MDHLHPNTSAAALARLVEYAHGCLAALPPHTTIELVENPVAIEVPGAAYYSLGLLAWQGRHIPLIDLDTLLRAYAKDDQAKPPRYALVTAFQRSPGSPVDYGAIALAKLPETVTVADDVSCAFPQTSDMWPLLAISCFQLDGQAVPVIDTSRLFGRYPG
jgi:chemotaxis signal transduction protein